MGSDEFRFMGSSFSNGLYWTGVSPVLEFIKHVFPLVCISIFYLPNGAGRFQHNSAGIQQAYMVDCFPCGWPPHSLDFNPTETLWERTLSRHLFRMLAILQWNSRQKCMFWHCIRLLKRCHFAQQKTCLKSMGEEAEANDCEKRNMQQLFWFLEGMQVVTSACLSALASVDSLYR